MTSQSDTKTSRIIEIIGLAGTGKTTTCKKLRDFSPEILPIYRVARSRLPGAILRSLRWYAENPAQRTLRDPAGGWTGLHLLIHMDGMVQDLLFQRRKRLGTLVLDQGPIFNCILAERLASQGEIGQSVPRRMRKLLVENLDFLDAIVILEADLPILLQRIHERGQDHQIKGTREGTARQFLDDYRKRYDSIVSEIQDRSDTQVLKLDTGRQGPDEIARDISSTFGLCTNNDATSLGRSTLR